MSDMTTKPQYQRLKRTLPFLQLLKQANNSQKRAMLKSFPNFVVDDIVEILYNILYKNVVIRNALHKSVLLRNKQTLSKIVKAHKHKRKRKQIIYQQSGGFLGALVPVIASVLSGLVSSAL